MRKLPASLRWLEVFDYTETVQGHIQEIFDFIPSTVGRIPFRQINVNCYEDSLGALVEHLPQAVAALRLKGIELRVKWVTSEEHVVTPSLDFFEAL